MFMLKQDNQNLPSAEVLKLLFFIGRYITITKSQFIFFLGLVCILLLLIIAFIKSFMLVCYY